MEKVRRIRICNTEVKGQYDLYFDGVIVGEVRLFKRYTRCRPENFQAVYKTYTAYLKSGDIYAGSTKKELKENIFEGVNH